MPDIASSRDRITVRRQHVFFLVTCLSGLNMPCLQSSTPPAGSPLSGQTPASGGYTTEADCLQACKEGACCEGTTCSVKPQCQCQGTGKTFKGVGTTCANIACSCMTPCFGNQGITATVSIQAEDYTYRVRGRAVRSVSPYSDGGAGMISFFQGSAISGTHALAPDAGEPYVLSKTIQGTGAFSSCDVCKIVLDLYNCDFNIYLSGFYETSLASWPEETEPKQVADLGCSTQSPPSGFFGAIPNPQWISRGIATLSSNFQFGVPSFRVGPGGLAGCSIFSGVWPKTFTIPQQWWTQGAYAGFYLVSDPSFTANQFGQTFPSPIIVRQQSGSRVVSASLSLSSNPLP